MTRQVLSNRFTELLAIKARREKRRISQREVARETGLAKRTVDSYARNEVTRYDAPVVLALCNYLGCDAGELLVIEDVEDPQMQTALLLA
ncbi:MAG: helix-turn-helix transcriptional regulator [Chloroflexi bacterium]|nr:helix-turn-helix transcriptional regulator [Chloroflexota bacterium]